MLSLMMKSESDDPYNDQHDDPDKKSSDHMEKRRIANSNERRRMQNINAGFESLRAQLSLSEGQKYSKASILQHAAQHLEDIQKELSVYQQQVKVYETAKLSCTCGSFNNQADNQESKLSEKCLESNLQDEGIGSPRDDDIITSIDDRYEMQQKTKPNNLTVTTKQTPVVSCSPKFITTSYKGIDSQQQTPTVVVGTTLRSVQVLPASKPNEAQAINKKYTNSPNILLHEGRSPRLLAVQGKPRHLIITGGKDSPTSKLIHLSTSTIKTSSHQQQRVPTNCITLLSSNLKTPLLAQPMMQKVKIESKKRSACEPTNNQSPHQHKYTKVNITPSLTSRLMLNNQENRQPPTNHKPPITFKPINRDTTTNTDDDKSVKRGGSGRLIAPGRKLLIGSLQQPSSSSGEQQRPIHISTLSPQQQHQQQQRLPIHISTLATTTPPPTPPQGQQQENTFLYKACIKTTEQPITTIPPTTTTTTSSITSSSQQQEQLTLNQLNNLRYAPVTVTSSPDHACDVVASSQNYVVLHPSEAAAVLPTDELPTTGPNVVTVQSVQDNENSPCRIGRVEVVIQPDDESSGTSTPMANNNQGNQLNTILAAIDCLERKEKRTKSQEESPTEEAPTDIIMTTEETSS